MSTLAERMKMAMDAAGVIPADLARGCGIKPASVSNWLSGETKSLKAATAISAAEILGVSALWLAEGRGPMKPTTTAPAVPAPSTETAGPALSAALADLLESARPLQDADVKLLTQLARRMNRSASLESTEIYGPAPQADVGRVAAFAEKLTKGS